MGERRCQGQESGKGRQESRRRCGIIAFTANRAPQNGLKFFFLTPTILVAESHYFFFVKLDLIFR
jgi:hypothetical protein